MAPRFLVREWQFIFSAERGSPSFPMETPFLKINSFRAHPFFESSLPDTYILLISHIYKNDCCLAVESSTFNLQNDYHSWRPCRPIFTPFNFIFNSPPCPLVSIGYRRKNNEDEIDIMIIIFLKEAVDTRISQGSSFYLYLIH